ncbi:MAG: 3-phosphoshikimate 1-carboxyvinyltransferase [Planctomycetota bacterium]
MGLRPGGPIRGSLRVPGSKSIAQRVLLAASLASGRTRIAGLPRGGDVDAALALVSAAGAGVERLAPAAVAITGRPPGPQRGLQPAGPVSAGESGTLARLATAALALASAPGRRYEIRAEGTLLRRESRALFEALAKAGVEIEHTARNHGWPARVRSIGPPSTIVIANPSSSQEVSALHLAAAAWPDEIVIEVVGEIPSRPYVELTRRTLERFGARIRGPLIAPSEPIEIEPDASSAAVLLAAGCLSGGRALALGLPRDSAQPDARAGGLFERFGIRTGWEDAGPWAEGVPDRGAVVDCSDTPDLAPVLAVLAATAAIREGASSRLTGLATLAGKESDRIAVLARGLSAVGVEARAGRDALEIGPSAGKRELHGVVLDPHGDHRMAFAFALLGLVGDGVSVADARCVAKSWPSFWEDLGSLG